MRSLVARCRTFITPLVVMGFVTLAAGSAQAAGWVDLALVSGTLGNTANKLCVGAGKADLGCPAVAPTLNPTTGGLTVTGDVTVTGVVSATAFWGDGSHLTNLQAGNIKGLNLDRITSGSQVVVINSASGVLGLYTGGSNWGYLAPGGFSYLPYLNTLGVSATGTVSATNGYFAGNVGIGSLTPRAMLDISTTNASTTGIFGAMSFVGGGFPSLNFNSYKTAGGATQSLNGGAYASIFIDTNPTAGANMVFARNGSNVGQFSNCGSGAFIAGGAVGTCSGNSRLISLGGAVIGSGYTAANTPANGLLVQGQVGISTTAPSSSLHVMGSVIVGVEASATLAVCDANRLGAIRYSGGSFSICQNTTNGWESLATTGANSLADRITSNSQAGVIANATGYISFTTGGVTGTSYINPQGVFVLPGVSATGTVSATNGYFAQNFNVINTQTNDKMAITLNSGAAFVGGLGTGGGLTVNRFGNVSVNQNGSNVLSVTGNGINAFSVTNGNPGTGNTTMRVQGGSTLLSNTYVAAFYSGSTLDAYLTQAGDLFVSHTLAIGSAAPSATLDVSGTMKMAYSGEACDANRLRAIAYTGGQFQVCRNTTTGWEYLTANGTGTAQADRIVSGTSAVTVNSSTGIISFTTNGVVAGYIDAVGNHIVPGVSATGTVSGTSGYFSGLLNTGTISTTGMVSAAYLSIQGKVVSASNPPMNSVLAFSGGLWTPVSITSALNISTTTMVANWPDAIQCAYTGGPTTNAVYLYMTSLDDLNNGTFVHTYNIAQGTTTLTMKFNPDGSVNSTGSNEATTGPYACGGTNTISVLYAQGRAFNFIGSNLISAAAPNTSLQYSNNGQLAGSGLYYVSSTGAVGIGVAAPSATLDVSGTMKMAYSNEACDATHLGAIRYSGGQFGICRNTTTGWEYLTANGTGTAQADRITSGTSAVTVNSATGIISFTTNGVVAGYIDASGNHIVPGVSATGAVSGTFGAFNNAVVGVSGTNTGTLNVWGGTVMRGNTASLQLEDRTNGYGFRYLMFADQGVLTFQKSAFSSLLNIGGAGILVGSGLQPNATPSSTLHIIGVSSTAGGLTLGDNLYAKRLYIFPDGVSSSAIQSAQAGGALNLRDTTGQYATFVGGQMFLGRVGTTPSATLDVSGTLKMAYSAEACDANRLGAIAYTGGQFQICRNTTTGWEYLTANGTGTAQADRIVSGTSAVTVNSSTGIISFTTNGVVAGYIDASGNHIVPGISVTTANGISSTSGYFSGNVGINTVPTATFALNVSGTTNTGLLKVSNSAILSTIGNSLAVRSGALTVDKDYTAFGNATGGAGGSANTVMGFWAMANTTGGNNSAFGDRAMYSTQAGHDNVAAGYLAGFGNITGSNNVAVGSGAQGSWPNSPNYGTYVGAGAGSISNGNYNVVVGYQAANTLTTGSNNILIGNTVQAVSNTTNYGLNIGNSIFGSMTNASSTGGAALIGINNINPSTSLDVSGTIKMAYSAEACDANRLGAIMFSGGQFQICRNATTGWENIGAAVSGTSVGVTAFASLTDVSVSIAKGNMFANGAALASGTANAVNKSTAFGVGALAGVNNTAGQNTAMGNNALYNTTTGYLNVAMGTSAMQNNTTGVGNAAVGYQALANNTTASGNAAMGNSALFSNTTGNYNAAMGNNALYSNTTGVANAAVGNSAMFYNTTGGNNAAVGDGALYSNTTGNSNAATGHVALRNNTTGSNNAAMGTSALQNNTTGGNNAAVGTSALFNNTTGGNNAGVGYQAMYYNATGTGNVAMGYGAGQGVSATTTVFSNSVLVGYQSGFGLTSGGNNTMLGYQTGYNVTSGASNTLVGWQAGSGLTTGSNNIMIGYNVQPSTAGDTNTLNIGNVIFGSLIPATSSITVSGTLAVTSNTTVSGTLQLSGTSADTCATAADTGKLHKNVTTGALELCVLR